MVKDIRITEPYVKRLVERIRAQTGESTPTRTASRLILERVAQLGISDQIVSPEPEIVRPDASKGNRKNALA